MAIPMGVAKPGEGGSERLSEIAQSLGVEKVAILPTGNYACRLHSVRVVEGTDYNTKQPKSQLEFTFASLKPLTAIQAKGDAQKVNQYGVCTRWTSITAYRVEESGGKDAHGNAYKRAALSVLIDQFFGRRLTEEEASQLDLSKLPGIVGTVTLIPNPNDPQKAVFAAFELPGNRPAPEPSAYFMDASDVASNAPVTRSVQTPTPKAVHDTTADIDDSDLEDPFA